MKRNEMLELIQSAIEGSCLEQSMGLEEPSPLKMAQKVLNTIELNGMLPPFVDSGVFREKDELKGLLDYYWEAGDYETAEEN